MKRFESVFPTRPEADDADALFLNRELHHDEGLHCRKELRRNALREGIVVERPRHPNFPGDGYPVLERFGPHPHHRLFEPGLGTGCMREEENDLLFGLIEVDECPLRRKA